MKSQLDYSAEKLDQAVRELATGLDSLRDRIGRAYRRFWHIREEEFPYELRADRLAIEGLLTKLPGREGYIIPDNLAAMDDGMAQEIAHNIVSLNDKIVRLRAQGGT